MSLFYACEKENSIKKCDLVYMNAAMTAGDWVIN